MAQPRLRNPTLTKKTSLQSDAPSVDTDDRGRPVFGSRRTAKGPDVVIGTDDPPTVKGEVNYFLRRPTDNAIQVGVTSNFRTRLSSHQRDARRSGFQWETLAVVRGDLTSEDALKKYFAEHALPHETEWFHGVPALYRYIRWLRDQSFVATCAADSDIDPVPADQWLPAPDRITKPFGLFVQEHILLPRVLTGDDYYTPTELIDAVRIGMGGIDLDPASHPAANRRHRIPRIYTANTNGLQKAWSGNVWINPPFGAWYQWSEAAVRELRSGRVSQLTALMSTPSITALYMQPLLDLATLRLTIKGRLEFWGRLVDEGNGCGPSSGHDLVYIGHRVQEMAAALKSLGTIWTPYRCEPQAAE